MGEALYCIVHLVCDIAIVYCLVQLVSLVC